MDDLNNHVFEVTAVQHFTLCPMSLPCFHDMPCHANLVDCKVIWCADSKHGVYIWSKQF